MTSLLLLSLASSTIDVDQISANGQEVRALHCELDNGGFMAGLMVVSTLAQQKPAMDACVPEGGAFEVQWTWAGGKATAEVLRASHPAKSACVQQALQATQADLNGSCKAIVLVGAPEGAAAAADGLQAATPAPEPTPTPAPSQP